MTTLGLTFREVTLNDIDVRIGYFHDSTDEHLLRFGVDSARLPSPQTWRERAVTTDSRCVWPPG